MKHFKADDRSLERFETQFNRTETTHRGTERDVLALSRLVGIIKGPKTQARLI